MSLALFRSTLRSAVRDAQGDDDAPAAPSGPRPQTALRLVSADDLRRIARGEISLDEALAALRAPSGAAS
ncbi:MAG TPA: hypothetical protein VME40_17935 [Caulobacteraceae bacterium]|nr:hypothetical protein [Caulobacteraceae bacterium]